MAGEMATFKDEWEDVLDKLETEIAHLVVCYFSSLKLYFLFIPLEYC